MPPSCPTGLPRACSKATSVPGKTPQQQPKQQEMFSPSAAAETGYATAHVDGGARGNPGPAGYGVVLRDASGKSVAELSRFLGIRTNNFAEYSGLIAALECALEKNLRALRVVSDSELMVRQINGQYKVRSPELRPLYEQAKALIHRFSSFRIEHARREQNKDADRLANRAMDNGMKR